MTALLKNTLVDEFAYGFVKDMEFESANHATKYAMEECSWDNEKFRSVLLDRAVCHVEPPFAEALLVALEHFKTKDIDIL